MTDLIAKAKSEGFNAYHALKKFYKYPELANISRGYKTECNLLAWNRGFNKALWGDKDRWVFLKRIA